MPVNVKHVNATSRSNVSEMPWTKTSVPFERVHLDHFVFNSKYFLVIVDDFSNWIDVQPNSSVSTTCVIDSLRKFFGLCQILVTDNGTCFVSSMFEDFCRVNNIIHKTSPAYRPQSNGLAERTVGITKNNLKKYLYENNNRNLSVESQLQNFLFKSHNTPLSSGKTPFEIIFNYKSLTNLTHLQSQRPLTQSRQCSPSRLQSKVQKQSHLSQSQKQWKHPTLSEVTNKNVKSGREYTEGDYVFYYNRLSKIWLEAKIVKRVSFLIYAIELENGHVLNAHVQCLKPKDRSYVPTYNKDDLSSKSPRYQLRPRNSHVNYKF